jgi:hypothetical protein
MKPVPTPSSKVQKVISAMNPFLRNPGIEPPEFLAHAPRFMALVRRLSLGALAQAESARRAGTACASTFPPRAKRVIHFFLNGAAPSARGHVRSDANVAQ